GFRIIADDEVKLASKGDSRLAIPLRRIKVKRDAGGTITLITNDLERAAVEIAQLYKGRWQIELLFRWIKQHLDIRNFLGTNENAIRLQVLAAMIAYLLLRIAKRVNCVALLVLRFVELVCQRIFLRRPIRLTNRHRSTRARRDQGPPRISWSSAMHRFSPDSPARSGGGWTPERSAGGRVGECSRGSRQSVC